MAWLKQFVASLPEDVRRAFTLRKVYGLSYPQIAARLDLTIADVENLLTHAVLKINEGLDAKKSGS